MSTYGAGDAKPTTARDALLSEISRTQASIEWLSVQLGELKPEQLVTGTKFVRTTTNPEGGKTVVAEAGSVRHELLALFIEERRHLHALCRDLISAEAKGPAVGSWPAA